MIYKSRLVSQEGKAGGAANIFKEMFAGEANGGGDSGNQSGNQEGGAVNFKDEMMLTLTCAAGLYNYSYMPGSEVKIVSEGGLTALAKMVLVGDEAINRNC